MTDQTKIADKDRPRPRLGDKALELAGKYTDGIEAVNGTHLEEGIAAQERLIDELRSENNKLKQRPSGLDKATIQLEFDHLFHDVRAEIRGVRDELSDGLNGIRLLLNVFSAELSGDEVSALVKDTNDWLDRVIKPISESRRDRSASQSKDGRPQDENENLPNASLTAEVNTPARQDEVPLAQEQELER